MPTDVVHYGRATESVMAPTVLSPRSILVQCTLARSENAAPVQGHVWLALQPMLRTPVLCVKPSNGPIEAIYFKTLAKPERDATGCGWHLISTTRVHCTAEFKSEIIIRLYPASPQTSDQQLDDVAAAIREFRAQAEAKEAGYTGPSTKLDFQHLLALPDGESRDELPEYFTQSGAQTSALEVGSPFYVCPQAAGLYQPQYWAVPDDMYFYKCEDSAADLFPAQGCGYGLASHVSALPSLSSQSDEESSEFSSSENDEAWTLPVCREWQLSNPDCVPRRLSSSQWRMVKSAWYSWLHFHQDLQQWHSTGTVIEDTSESDCDLPRASTQDFRLDSASCSDDSSIEGDYESYDGSETYSDCSYDSFEAPDWYFHDHDSYFEHLSTSDSVPPPCTRNSWRSACHITIDEADLDGTWELPSLTASDCGGELELIRYTVCTSAIAFEDSAAAAISWERSVSLGGRLDRAHFASQIASAKDYWENRQGLLRRRHAIKAPPAKFSTKRGRRQHQQELRRARSHRKSRRDGVPRPAQPAVQCRSQFPFAPPTAPTIPLTASKGVFTFGAAVRSDPSIHRPANLSIEPRAPGRDTGIRTVSTTQSSRPKFHRGPGRCKLNGVIPSSDLLQPDNLPSPADDSSVEDSDYASDASTVPLLVTFLSLIRGLRSDFPHRRRKVRSCKSSWPVPQWFATDTDLGKHCWESRRHSSRCTRALMRALGRSKWLNGLCRCLHSGCTDGSGPRPSLEP